MSDTLVIVHSVIAVLAIVLLIVRLRFSPVVALVLGALYLGIATGLGAATTVATITKGFGDISAELGLLIGFGVLTGAILQRTGAIERLVGGLLRIFGPRGVPYALALTIATCLQSIFLDVLLVISAPLAKGVASKLDRYGTARMATALAIALECGIVFTVPGVGALALAGLLDVPLGEYLVFGLVVVVPTVLVSVWLMSAVLTRGWWKPDLDEEQDDSTDDSADGSVEVRDDPAAGGAGSGGSGGGVRTAPAPAQVQTATRQAPLIVLFAPLVVSLLLIALGALSDALSWNLPAADFLANPVVALLIALVGTCFVGRATIGQKGVEEALGSGIRESGQILLLTGVGGSLAAVVVASGLGDLLGEAFGASTVAPLLVVWVIAAALHVAVGSVTLAAITSAGLLAPVAPSIGLDPVLLALAAGAGSLFVVHLTSNTFWLLQTLMGQTTRGTLKTCSIGVSLASVVAMGPILLLSLFL